MRLIYVVLLFILSSSLYAQEIPIDSIYILGNKHTKDRVILRELTFSVSETISIDDDLDAIAEYNENRILSLGLFNKVSIDFKESSSKNSLIAVIVVNENWYIYPSPIFELADRNFNLWWYDLNRDLSRVNYGIRGEHINLTGNRDKLSLTVQGGYTRKLELKYNFPFIDSEGKWSASFNAFYSDVKEIAYQTIGNKTQFGRFNDEVMLTRRRFSMQVGYRKDLFVFHDFRFEFHNNSINEFAAESLNPNYFLFGDTRNRFLYFNYALIYDKREFIIYPESGFYFLFNFRKEGLYVFNDYNNMSVWAEFEQFFNYNSKLLWNYKVKAKTNLIRNQLAFANNSALGWGRDVIRGYELYAVDGSDYVYLKTGLHYKFFERSFDISKAIPLAQFNKIDLKFYLAAGFDMGYVNERHYAETNDFSNRLIYGYGPSFNIMIYNTYLFIFDYSFNHLGEGGLYISNRISF